MRSGYSLLLLLCTFCAWGGPPEASHEAERGMPDEPTPQIQRGAPLPPRPVPPVAPVAPEAPATTTGAATHAPMPSVVAAREAGLRLAARRDHVHRSNLNALRRSHHVPQASDPRGIFERAAGAEVGELNDGMLVCRAVLTSGGYDDSLFAGGRTSTYGSGWGPMSFGAHHRLRSERTPSRCPRSLSGSGSRSRRSTMTSSPTTSSDQDQWSTRGVKGSSPREARP